MGMLVDGRWVDADSTMIDGRFVRPESMFRQGLDGIAGRLRAQPRRYWLIASSSCPWSHRTLLLRALKRLEHAVPVQIAGGERMQGYAVAGGASWVVPGCGSRVRHLHEVYRLSAPRYTGRATVPVLWDSQACRIVSNESSHIMRAFDAADANVAGAFTLVPPAFRGRIDALNAALQGGLFNAVYRAGFAQRQDAYEEAVESVFAMLDQLERRLANARYLFGLIITETDWRLFPTLVRFDAVYHGHFKCARRRLIDYPHLWAYARDLYSWRGVAATVDLDVIRNGYYRHDRSVNPFGIIAVAPDADWSAAHGRERFGPARVTLASGQAIEVDPMTHQRGEAVR
ncbi:glutathione S-transferase family protein [Stenotrophomonas maltophilia]|uniref:glutathione S-transferase family protein n=1 Tax=Stenotrophomonas maltophilia TaxID=40324 RepID=UPI0009C09BB6|nr:glutathione S-transferase C-terminal domain-containing protein [Stenotrophomonas maltophilia]